MTGNRMTGDRMTSPTHAIGLVAIGRNEGERLKQCIDSIVGRVATAIYVDSASTDDSVAYARSQGIEVVELDMSLPFTAARARNAGYQRLRELNPEVRFVQFIDGDCAVVAGWLERAMESLASRDEAVVVWGRRMERYPEASIYNRLCDNEWRYDFPYGEVAMCGGDALMRVEAFEAVGGFNEALIAGEEPELCYRLRQNGGKILRIDADMTLHDANMTHFSQWWKRAVRSGHAYAEGAWLGRHDAEKRWASRTRRIWLWGALIPTLAIVPAPFTYGLSLVLLGLYPFSAYRQARHMVRHAAPWRHAMVSGGFSAISKFPALYGLLKFHYGRLRGSRSAIIEYK